MSTVYRAAVGFEEEFQRESASRGLRLQDLGHGLWLEAAPARPLAWVDDIWFDVVETAIASIGEAARQLRAVQAWWCHQPLGKARRGELVRERLPRRREAELRLPPTRPLRPTGIFGLPEQHGLLYAARRQRPFSGTPPALVEDRLGPPSRAYRKLWEALLLLDRWPRPGERCWDLGAAPGAWTWVLAELGASVLAVDKAPLAPAIASLPAVTTRQGSAFAMDPDHDPVDWICSDVICYPDRLLRTVERWLASGSCTKFIITVKCQGHADPAVLDAFRALPHSQLVHLGHNKHELTWIRHPELPAAGGALAWPWIPG